jgi:hypothetical protein
MPDYAVEEAAQLCSPLGMDAFDEGDAAIQMSMKVGDAFAVLARGTMAETVGENCFELVDVFAWNAEMLVDYEAGELLARGAALNASLAIVGSKAFFQENGGDMIGEGTNTALEVFIAGEGEVIGVPCVNGVACGCESTKAAIDAPGANIGKDG